MTAWDPQNPPLLLPRPGNREFPGAGGYPFQGLWDPHGEGNPLLWSLIALLTGDTPRAQKKGSRKNIVDRRAGRIPLDQPRERPHRVLAPPSPSETGLSPLDVLIRWINNSSADGVRKRMEQDQP